MASAWAFGEGQRAEDWRALCWLCKVVQCVHFSCVPDGSGASLEGLSSLQGQVRKPSPQPFPAPPRRLGFAIRQYWPCISTVKPRVNDSRKLPKSSAEKCGGLKMKQNNLWEEQGTILALSKEGLQEPQLCYGGHFRVGRIGVGGREASFPAQLQGDLGQVISPL